MKFKKITFTLIFMAFFVNALYAQNDYMMSTLNNLIGELSWNKTMQTNDPNIQGSPYLADDFVNGVIFFDGKFKVEGVPLRYNLYNDEMEFKEKGVVMAIAEPKRINKIELGEDTFIYIEKGNQEKVSGFVKIWNEGYPCVITRMKTNFLKKEPAKPYVEPKPERFERDHDEHFILINKNEIERIGSVKKLIQKFDDHQDDLKEFAKKEKISSSNIQEVAKLVAYYQSLE